MIHQIIRGKEQFKQIADGELCCLQFKGKLKAVPGDKIIIHLAKMGRFKVLGVTDKKITVEVIRVLYERNKYSKIKRTSVYFSILKGKR